MYTTAIKRNPTKPMNLIDQLNQQFSIDGHLAFEQGKGELPLITVSNKYASATISLHGGQVLSYQQTNSEHDLLFVSDNAYFQPGKAIKGGAPICWPWFGAHPEDSSLPAHGLVRNQLWQVDATEYRDNGEVVITLLYTDTEQTRQCWPYAFELREVISIGAQLQIALITTNTGGEAFNITQAIHTYFRVADCTQIQISGLENKLYLDKVTQFSEKQQQGPVTIDQEVDRIYQHIDQAQCIEDKVRQRRIRIDHAGSATCVVWNPWQAISRSSADLCDDDYQRFICVETANAAQDRITIQPGDSYTLSASYQID